MFGALHHENSGTYKIDSLCRLKIKPIEGEDTKLVEHTNNNGNKVWVNNNWGLYAELLDATGQVIAYKLLLDFSPVYLNTNPNTWVIWNKQ
jgi:hypothetical protein